MHTYQSAAAPAQSKNKSPGSKREVFEWYENRSQDEFGKLYRVDVAQRQHIEEIIDELEDASMFWSLMTRYDDARQLAGDDNQKEHAALMGLVARVYIAGTLRGCQAVDL